MRIFLHYPAGRRLEAVLLASSPNRMRIVVRGQTETVELQQRQGRWYSEKGKRIEFDAILAEHVGETPAPAAEPLAAGAANSLYQ